MVNNVLFAVGISLFPLALQSPGASVGVQSTFFNCKDNYFFIENRNILKKFFRIKVF